MILMPAVEQHHMIPFHHPFLNTQFMDEGNIKTMKERLIAGAESANHWFNDLVQELTSSPDTEVFDNLQPTYEDPMTPEYDLHLVSEALSELEPLHPERFRESSLPEVTEHNFVSTDEELTDGELLKALNQYDEEVKVAFDSYDYLLENEVGLFPLL